MMKKILTAFFFIFSISVLYAKASSFLIKLDLSDLGLDANVTFEPADGTMIKPDPEIFKGDAKILPMYASNYFFPGTTYKDYMILMEHFNDGNANLIGEAYIEYKHLALSIFTCKIITNEVDPIYEFHWNNHRESLCSDKKIIIKRRLSIPKSITE